MDIHSTGPTGESEPPNFADVRSASRFFSLCVAHGTAACPTVTAPLTQRISPIPRLTIAFAPPHRRLTEPQISWLVAIMSLARAVLRRQPARGMERRERASKPTESAAT